MTIGIDYWVPGANIGLRLRFQHMSSSSGTCAHMASIPALVLYVLVYISSGSGICACGFGFGFEYGF